MFCLFPVRLRIPKVAVVDCFWYDFVLRCRFPVRPTVAVFICFRYYFVPITKVVRFRTLGDDAALLPVSGTIKAPPPS